MIFYMKYQKKSGNPEKRETCDFADALRLTAAAVFFSTELTSA
jgi:hypothetical protein